MQKMGACESSQKDPKSSHEKDNKSSNDEKSATQSSQPTVDESVLLSNALLEIEKCVVKLDHFEAIYRLQPKIEGVPNYRKVDGYPVFGSGQPTLDGFKLILSELSKMGLKAVQWVNMRSEPVIYVNNWSFGPRNIHDLNENIQFVGITIPMLAKLETALADTMKKKALSADNKHHYYKDTYAENPADRKNMLLTDDVKDISEIRKLETVYEYLRTQNFNVNYTRLPINDERSPSLEDFDRLVNVLKAVDPQTAVYFNCQMGKGRTTTGMVVAILMIKVRDTSNKIQTQIQAYDPQKPDYKMGQFKVIMELVKALGSQGEKIKSEVDDAIDRCFQMQNLRECILYTKQMYDKETEERRKFWKRMSINFIERYFYLILFHAYLRETTAPPSNSEEKKDDQTNEKEKTTKFVPFSTTFTRWHTDHKKLVSILGNREDGALALFDWT